MSCRCIALTFFFLFLCVLQPAEDVVHAWVKVLGDRSSLWKYLNPNVITVSTSPSAAPPGLSSVTVHLIDTVTGRMLYRVRFVSRVTPRVCMYV